MIKACSSSKFYDLITECVKFLRQKVCFLVMCLSKILFCSIGLVFPVALQKFINQFNYVSSRNSNAHEGRDD